MACLWIFRHFEMKSPFRIETSGTVSPSDIPEERIPQLHRSESPKARILVQLLSVIVQIRGSPSVES